jgi:predicted nucleic acid-binding Zn ribbon protein
MMAKGCTACGATLTDGDRFCDACVAHLNRQRLRQSQQSCLLHPWFQTLT